MKKSKRLKKNKTWELVEPPEGCKPIDVKWVYKKKLNAQGEVERYMARLVAKGYRQKAGIDYDEVFAHVARMETIRLLISQAAQYKWTIYQMDMKSAFLNGLLEEVVYANQPFTRAWNTRIDAYFKKNIFVQCPYEDALYVKEKQGNLLLGALYVDDLIFMGNNEDVIEDFKKVMTQEFEMTDLGLMRFFLGIEVKQDKSGIFISQKTYANSILKKF